MSSNRNLEVTIRQYLLGQLTGEGLEQFEQRLFADDDLFENVLAAENELIDESIDGELNPPESALFARSLLNTPEGKKKLLFRRVLKNYAERKKKPVPVPKRWSFLPSAIQSFRAAMAAAVVIIAGFIGLVPLIRTLQPATFAPVNLTITTNERALGAQAVQVRLPLNVDELRAHLALPEPLTPAQGYRVELVKDNGETSTLKIVAQDEKSLDVAIPASQLAPGLYALNLYVTKTGGGEQRIAGSYYLTVE